MTYLNIKRISLFWEDELPPPGYHPWIDEHVLFSPDRPAFVLSTSGTTGRRKGVVQTTRRLTVNNMPSGSADDTFLLHSPIYHGQGFTGFLSAVLKGIRVEVHDKSALSGRAIWNRLAQGGLTILIGPTGLWLQLMEYFEEHIARLSPTEQGPYVSGAKSLRSAICAVTMPTISLKQFWKGLLGGTSLQVAYGSMETGAISITLQSPVYNLERSIGEAQPGVTIKLSEGDHGEMLVKTPSMFLGYLDQSARDIVDEQGFFKTGDIAHFQDGELILDGRAKTDFISTINSKVSILEVELSLQSLPYVTEACVLAIPDAAVRYRVGCLLRIRRGEYVNLERIREDLSSHLEAYKIPTVLRCLSDGESIPRTGTEKIIRFQTARNYFPQTSLGDTGSLPPDVESPSSSVQLG
ncbi:long-chain fatty acid--CoA ligase [Aspergillus novofumigatus IBT 16806]|uniref:Acetyl-CoA synthetase-like protein n=1 Tax=Aspergillus novofumigatus (strain IBT 16806) TaxID=1392255 RepID=A0A2I1CCR6_ASPN1|nr:acetyl-CoA synthetase-like protein [Aspergillus novofumigatus IBT 16806]PKX95423.1 acetyl-CoA synthetase-like protein [Aspergillus novofumigatus IBT 16806]